MIYEGAIPSMLRRLDPHTQFFEPTQFDQLKQMEASEQKGFGSIVSVLPGQVIFLQIFPGTPTSKAGIQPGDELVAINNVAIRALDPEQIVQLLTQARQQKIVAYLRRRDSSSVLQATLTPELENAHTVDRAFLLSPGIGYIRITSWDTQTARELEEAIGKLNAPPLDGLVLDLRANPGGIVQSALEAASFFLAPGQRILTAKGRTGTVESADVPKSAQPYHFKLAVLVDDKTASASEIFSGALQDHDRAVVVGEPTYGKGLVQSVLSLSNNAGLALTTAFYYTPSGRSIQRPLRDSALSATFGTAPMPHAPQYKTDNGRAVTGGGGIRPDVEIAPEALTRLEEVMEESGATTAFATGYLAQHSPLAADFAITPAILDDFKVYLGERNIQPSTAEWSSELPWIRSRLMEEIVTQARGVAAGDQIADQRDVQVQAAIEALRNTDLLKAAAP
jgi:carboxyl-terminal processing protease